MQVTFNNITLNYDRIGLNSQNGPILLFLHEALGSIKQWKDFPSRLCTELNLSGIIYERQGHGASSPLSSERTAQYLHQYALEELPAFLNAIQETRPLILIGHSDGGTIALLFASAFPDRVAGIVTMAAHVINEPETVAGIAPAISAYEAGKLSGLEKYHGGKTPNLFYAWADIWRSDVFRNWNITKEISNSNAKGLFIQGTEDQYGTERQIELISKHYIGEHTTQLLEKCGHHPHLEQTEIVLNVIKEWWNSGS
ncbi:MAG: alpha/beta fold hydrolase [Fluviicola sp.]